MAIDEAAVEPMPQYLQLWSVQVNEEAIRQPAAVIRLNGPGMPAIEVRQLHWSPRSGYIEIYNKDDPNRPIIIPDPDARPEDFSWHWYGKAGYTTLSLTVERGVLAGRVWLRDKRYALRPSAAGLLLGQTNSSYWQLHPRTPETGRPKRFPAGTDLLPEKSVPNSSTGAWDYSCSAPLSEGYRVIDVLVLYTQGILDDYGSSAGVDAEIRDALDSANLALRNSGIFSFSYHLSSVELLPNSGSLDQTDIVNAHAAVSGYTPVSFPPYCQVSANNYVLGRRDSVNADIVALARRDLTPSPTCGYSFIQRLVPGQQDCGYEPGPEFERLAYLVFDPECDADSLNFAHELGHQLGADHDPRNYTPLPSGGASSCPWSYGHRSDDSTLGFRTVMAYPTLGFAGPLGPECDDDDDCPLIDAFSTPALEWTGSVVQPIPSVPQGLPIGIGSPPPNNWQQARNTDTLQRLAVVSSSFRQRPDSVFSHGFE